jgi:predicted nucleic-acid-binding protein
MIGIDTNVLVRYLADDDRTQSPRAARLMASLTTQAPGFVSLIALVEAVWVMESSYAATRDEVLGIVEPLLTTRTLVVENAPAVRNALQRYARGAADFADCLIACLGEAAGTTATMTFDKRAARHASMTLLVF